MRLLPSNQPRRYRRVASLLFPMQTVKPTNSRLIPAINTLLTLSATMKPGRANMLVSQVAEAILPHAQRVEKQLTAIRHEHIKLDEQGQLKTKNNGAEYDITEGHESEFNKACDELLTGTTEIQTPVFTDVDLDRIEAAYIGTAPVNMAALTFLMKTEG